MAKNAVNYTGLIPETGDSFESATQNTTGSFDGIDTKIGTIDDNITNIDDEIRTINTSLSGHISNISNPHSVTKSQIGLGNVDNTSDLIKMTASTFSDLNTTDKTIIGAINETIVTDSNINGNIKIAGVESEVYTHPNHSGDVVSTGDGITVIQNNIVDNSKMTQMEAKTLKGNKEIITGNVQDLTVSEVQTMLSDSTHRFVTDSEKAQWNSASAGVNTGDIIYRTSNTVPNGYMKANGAVISRTTYANLFSVIGTTFGAGDGSTTFNLPDLRGEFIRGWDDGKGADSGRTLGSWQDDMFETHKHLENTLHITGYDGKTFSNGNGSEYRGSQTDYRISTTGGMYTATSPYTQNTGGIETRPRNVALMAIIKY